MLDSRIRPFIDPPLSACARVVSSYGIHANIVTAAGFLIALLCFFTLSLQMYGLAILFIFLNRCLDGLDGAVARINGATDLGGYLDIVSDFIFYAGVVFFFALGRPDMALPAAFLIFSFVGTGTSFLAYAIIAAKCGKITEHQGKKSFYYLSGLTEGFETIVFLLMVCIFPAWFGWMAVFFGALCWVTTFGRVRAGIIHFGQNP
jgi:phosphatidylglycerophosphate synthase